MTSNPRSVVIGAYQTVTVNEQKTLVTVPNGVTLIVKSFAIENRGTGPALMSVFLRHGAGTPFMNLFSSTLQIVTPQLVTTSVVLGPGDSLFVSSALVGGCFWVSGTVLQGVGVIGAAAGTLPSIPELLPPTSS